jgi:predicted amidophosphoribosyltransferase
MRVINDRMVECFCVWCLEPKVLEKVCKDCGNPVPLIHWKGDPTVTHKDDPELFEAVGRCKVQEQIDRVMNDPAFRLEQQTKLLEEYYKSEKK